MEIHPASANGAVKRVPLFRRYGTIAGLFGFFAVLFFQNCDGGFHYDPGSGSLTSASTGGGVGSDQFRLTTFSPNGIVVPEGQSFEGGVEYRVVGSGQNVPTATLMWQLLSNTGNCVLKSATTPETRYVMCDKSGSVTIQATSIWQDGTSTVLASTRTTAALIVDACGASNSSRVVFRIPSGTASAAWNYSASPVVVYVGQTLRICNDDSTAHQLHTDGTPCPHQPNTMAKGAFYDCSVANANGVNATTGLFNNLYDHVVGTNAAFYVRPFDGQALYAATNKTSNGQSCVSCHNGFANSTKKGANFTNLKNAIMNNTGGMGIYNGRITDDELRAIVFALNR